MTTKYRMLSTTNARDEIDNIYLPDYFEPVEIPYVRQVFAAGFPSPAEDSIHERIDLNLELITNPTFTFYGRVAGDSMEPTFPQGALLIIDTKETVRHLDAGLFIVEGKYCLKRFYSVGKKVELRSDNEDYDPIALTVEMEARAVGRIMHHVVTHKKKTSD